jgi:AcrR family transcriptional regulator
VPTGVHIRDVRELLFSAAERVLLRDGPNGLTSRAVTAEAGVAKGVLHRHFADFDAFLVDLVLDRARRVEDQAAVLYAAAGTGTVAGNVTRALTDLFESVALEITSLLIFRDDLRTRLREITSVRIPVVMEAVAMLVSYLTAERELGRVAADADVETLAPMLIGSAHLLFADRKGTPPDADAIRKMVTTAIPGLTPDLFSRG